MTRKELVNMRDYQIGTASTEYWYNNMNSHISIIEAFEDGIDCADNHPKNPWISIKEKPTKTNTYFVRTCEGCVDIAFYDKNTDQWYDGKITNGTPNYYMEIPELKNKPGLD